VVGDALFGLEHVHGPKHSEIALRCADTPKCNLFRSQPQWQYRLSEERRC
jgi:hypothetical protein